MNNWPMIKVKMRAIGHVTVSTIPSFITSANMSPTTPTSPLYRHQYLADYRFRSQYFLTLPSPGASSLY